MRKERTDGRVDTEIPNFKISSPFVANLSQIFLIKQNALYNKNHQSTIEKNNEQPITYRNK